MATVLAPTADDLAFLESDHQRKYAPHLLSVANPIRLRIIVERAVIRRAVQDLIAAGNEVRVSYGEGDYGCDWCMDVGTVMGAVNACDEEWIKVRRVGEDRAFGWVFLVYGNDGWDVINDHTVNLEEVLKGANDYADSLAG